MKKQNMKLRHHVLILEFVEDVHHKIIPYEKQLEFLSEEVKELI